MKILIVTLIVAVTLTSAITPNGLDYKTIKLPSSVNVTEDGTRILKIGSVSMLIPKDDWSAVISNCIPFRDVFKRINSESKEAIMVSLSEGRNKSSHDLSWYSRDFGQTAWRGYLTPLANMVAWFDNLNRVEDAMYSQFLHYNITTPLSG